MAPPPFPVRLPVTGLCGSAIMLKAETRHRLRHRVGRSDPGGQKGTWEQLRQAWSSRLVQGKTAPALQFRDERDPGHGSYSSTYASPAFPCSAQLMSPLMSENGRMTTKYTRSAASRLCLFSSDSYGFGHVVRNSKVANAATRRNSGITTLLITGTDSRDLPPVLHGIDYLRLPAFQRLPGGKHESCHLRVSYEELREFRSHVLSEVLRRWVPAAILVDHITVNIRAEIERSISSLGEGGTVKILAFDDVLNHPEAVEKAWVTTGLLDFAAECFDEIWVYGSEKVFDWSEHYRLPPPFAARLRYMGYLGERPSEYHRKMASAKLAASYQTGEKPLVLVTGGGGHDSAELFGRYLDALGRHDAPDVVSLLVTGPLMSPSKVTAIRERLANMPASRVIVRTFVPDLEDTITAADAVVSMGGCLTVSEILAAGTPAAVIPRTQWTSSQQIRAQVLAQHGWLEYLPLEQATPSRLNRTITTLLSTPHGSANVTLTGLRNSAERLLQLATAGSAHAVGVA